MSNLHDAVVVFEVVVEKLKILTTYLLTTLTKT